MYTHLRARQSDVSTSAKLFSVFRTHGSDAVIDALSPEDEVFQKFLVILKRNNLD